MAQHKSAMDKTAAIDPDALRAQAWQLSCQSGALFARAAEAETTLLTDATVGMVVFLCRVPLAWIGMIDIPLRVVRVGPKNVRVARIDGEPFPDGSPSLLTPRAALQPPLLRNLAHLRDEVQQLHRLTASLAALREPHACEVGSIVYRDDTEATWDDSEGQGEELLIEQLDAHEALVRRLDGEPFPDGEDEMWVGQSTLRLPDEEERAALLAWQQELLQEAADVEQLGEQLQRSNPKMQEHADCREQGLRLMKEAQILYERGQGAEIDRDAKELKVGMTLELHRLPWGWVLPAGDRRVRIDRLGPKNAVIVPASAAAFTEGQTGKQVRQLNLPRTNLVRLARPWESWDSWLRERKRGEQGERC